MAKRELQNGSQTPSKRQRTETNHVTADGNHEDDEQHAYNEEIRLHDRQHGSALIPRPALEICPKTNFRTGSLLQIYMKNVMSYDECLVNFGPTLNFVIGPNGSGKSTMLAAIVLAFAAPITCMGKASLKAQQLIKSTKDELEVRVVVKNKPGEPNLTFKRTLARSEKQGKFYINNTSVTMKEVRARARDLDIQVMSMTRFLPQDRVKDFTTMSPKDLLITTMEDVGYKNMRSHYDLLVNQQEHSADDEHKLKLATDALADLERRSNDLAGKIAQLEEREKQEERVATLEKVAVYTRGLSLKEKKERLLLKKEQLLKRFELLTKERDELKRNLEKCQGTVAKYTQSLSSKETDAKAMWVRIRELKNRESEINSKMAKYEGELDTAKRRLEEHEHESRELKEKVEEAETAYKNLCEVIDDPSFQEKKEACRQRQIELEKESVDAKVALRELEAKYRVESDKGAEIFSQLESERLKNNRFQPVVRANSRLVEMVQEVAPRGQYRYSLPAINNVRLKNNRVEDQQMVSTVVRALATQFVARDSSATSQIGRVPARVSVREVTKSLDEASRGQPLDRVRLRALGFDGYILDLVEGPDHNLAHLCEVAKIHAVPYSREGLSPQQIGQLPPSIGKFISKNMLYTVKRSRYGQKLASTKTEAIDVFPVQNDSQIIYEKLPNRDRENELSERYQEFAERIRPIKEEVKAADSVFKDKNHLKTELADKMRNLRIREGKKDSMEKNLRFAQNKYNKHVKNPPESMEEVHTRLEEKRGKIREDVAETVLKRVKVVQKLAKIVADSQKDAIELSRVNVQTAGYKTRFQEIGEERGVFKENYSRLKEKIQAAEAEYEEYKSHYKEDEEEQEVVELFEALKQDYEGEDFLMHVDAQIGALRSELTFANVDMDARNKYEEVVRQAEQTRKEVEHLTDKRANAASEMQKTIDVFVPALESIVDLISSRFAELLSVKEKASGVVILRKVKEKANPNDPGPEEPLPFSQWGIEIMVSFREGGSRCKLDGTTQSGGERSISIGTYLLALQKVAPVAFRALDEINQALDAKNEVIMNQHVADTAAQCKQQLFLLSPKLIRFNYPRGMRILTICNGSGVATRGESKGSFLALRHLQGIFS
ncbi:Structural maintenance of chromosomes protein 5 [Yarrowia sp. E02]|nr:Structural maintenance of chromosomes protein 5 [Yarrowia sp. E02]